MHSITANEDRPITLRALRNSAGGQYAGGRLDIRTLHRFVRKGVRGRKLSATKTPAGWVTTTRAWVEFVAATDVALQSDLGNLSERHALSAAATLSQRAKQLAPIDTYLRSRGQ